MAIQDPRFHQLSAATALDGTTALTSAWTDGLILNNANAGRVAAAQASVGRISWLKQLRNGTVGAMVMARSLVSNVTLEVRTATTAELAECKNPTPAPVNNDILISTQQLTTAWSSPLLLGPTDALKFQRTELGAGTVEWQNVDITSAQELAWIEGILAAAGASADCCTTDSITVAATGVLDPFGVKTRFVYISAAANSTVEYPLLADLELGQRLVLARVGGSVCFIKPQGVETQNGDPGGIIELDGFTAVIVERRETGFIATKQTVTVGQSLSIAVADETVAITAPIAPNEPVRIETLAAGFAQLPRLVDSAVGDSLQILRNGGTFQIVLIPQAGELLNSVANGKFYLGFNDVAVARKTSFGWNVVGDGGCRPAKTLTTAGDVTLDRWGAGILIVQATKAGAQTITLPSNLLDICPGCIVMFGCQGAGGLTIDGGGANIRSGTGAPAATMVLAQHENAWLIWDGTVWTAILGT